MTEPKWTPGPWHISDEPYDYRRIIRAPKAEYVARLGENLGEWEANARLIAAAPELYEACEAQHGAIDWLMDRLIQLDDQFLPSKSEAWPALVAGNAALAKARGETP